MLILYFGKPLESSIFISRPAIGILTQLYTLDFLHEVCAMAHVAWAIVVTAILRPLIVYVAACPPSNSTRMPDMLEGGAGTRRDSKRPAWKLGSPVCPRQRLASSARPNNISGQAQGESKTASISMAIRAIRSREGG